MIIAGPCLYYDESQEREIIETAEHIKDFVDIYRCKLWGGGTQKDRYANGVGSNGIDTLDYIDKNIMQTMTEIQTPEQLKQLKDSCSYVWIGARNSSNYGLFKHLSKIKNPIFIKRGTGMTLDETNGIYEILTHLYRLNVYIIERGINYFGRTNESRWTIALNDIVRCKIDYPELFKNYVIDCSHSTGRKELIQDTYNAALAIGCRHYMFECTLSGSSKTDSGQMLSVNELRDILK